MQGRTTSFPRHPRRGALCKPPGGGAAAALALALAGLVAPAQATVIEKKDFVTLVAEAELIAVARVTAVEAHPTLDHRYAYTYVELGELEVLKGIPGGETLTLRFDGGPLGDGRFLAVVGVPDFAPGQRIVAFVRGNGRAICPLVGWHQGLLRVVPDAAGTPRVATHDGRLLRGFAGGDFLVAGRPDRAETSPGAGEDGRVDPPVENAAGDPAGLTLPALLAQVRATLAELGDAAGTPIRVASADLEWIGPGSQPDGAPQGRN